MTAPVPPDLELLCIFWKCVKSKFYHCLQHINPPFLVFITHNPTGSGKISNWSSLVNILKGHCFKMLPQVSWFQQFCFICQGADKSLALKTANTTIIINNEIHPQMEPVPASHSALLTASWGFPTVGDVKSSCDFPPYMQMVRGSTAFIGAQQDSRMGPDGKVTSTDALSEAAMQQLVPDISYKLVFSSPTCFSACIFFLRSLHYHLPNGPS